LAAAGKCQLLSTTNCPGAGHCSHSFTQQYFKMVCNFTWFTMQVSQLTMHQLDRLVGLSMLIAATSIFVYYTVWTLFMVCARNFTCSCPIIQETLTALYTDPHSHSSTTTTSSTTSSCHASGPSASLSSSSFSAPPSSAASSPSS
jgi:hypothetical protein